MKRDEKVVALGLFVVAWLVVVALVLAVQSWLADPWEFQSVDGDYGTSTYWSDGRSTVEVASFGRMLTAAEICEVMLCGVYGTADGDIRNKTYGTDDCNCSHVECCTESETK